MANRKTTSKKTTTTSKKSSPAKRSPSSNKSSVRSARIEKTIDIPEPKSTSKPVSMNEYKAMETQKKRKGINKTALILGVIILLFALLYIFRSAFLVAFVNGQPVSTSEFNHQMQVDAGQKAMSEVVEKKLIFQEAQKKNITISDSDVNKQITSITATLKKQGQTLDQALAAKGLSKQDLVDQIKIKLIVDKILGPQVKVSDKDVQDYIDKNKEQFGSTEINASMKAGIKQQMTQQKLQDKFTTWVQDLQTKAKINYLIKV
jgi:parvulin-like peptidyl-prolyl isomerase